MKNKKEMENRVHVLKHPLAMDILTQLRDVNTAKGEFKRLVPLAASILFYESMISGKMKKVSVETPYATTNSFVLDENFIFVGIMRAGLALLDGLIHVYPNAPVGHIGIYRDKQMNCTVEYFFRLPRPLENKTVILTDFALASGDTADAAISRLKDYKVGPIKLLTLLATENSIKRMIKKFSDVEIYTLSIEKLDDSNRCIPGMGDAGERIYGTI